MTVNYDLKPENTKVILHNGAHRDRGDLESREYICYKLSQRAKRKYCLIISSEEGFRNRIMPIISQRSMRTSILRDESSSELSLFYERALEFLGKTCLEVAKLPLLGVQEMLGNVRSILEEKIQELKKEEKETPRNIKPTPVMIFNGVINSQDPYIPFGGLKLYQDLLKKQKKS